MKPFRCQSLLLSLLACALPARALAAGPADYLNKPDDWFRSDEGRRITANVLSHQSDLGSWPKNLDTTAAPYTGDPLLIVGTFDNRATTDELRFLARAFNATRERRDDQAFLKGLDHILRAQYPTGGWPQLYPPGKGYHRYITFNDDAMVRLMEFLREVAAAKTYDFVAPAKRKAAQAAFDRGIDCILKCQVRVDGKLTAWCAQHDERDYRPRPGRTYELVSLSGAESVGITRLLMSLDHPRPEVVQAVEGAVAWFEAAKLKGIRVVQRDDPAAPRGRDRVVIQDPAAPPLWARFYEISTNRPIFADRDGIPKRTLAEIGYERRNGYAWLGTWPATLLSRDYPAWKAQRAKGKAPGADDRRQTADGPPSAVCRPPSAVSLCP
jgi:pectate lyase